MNLKEEIDLAVSKDLRNILSDNFRIEPFQCSNIKIILSILKLKPEKIKPAAQDQLESIPQTQNTVHREESHCSQVLLILIR